MDPTNSYVTSWIMKEKNSEKTASDKHWKEVANKKHMEINQHHKKWMSEGEKWNLLGKDFELDLPVLTLANLRTKIIKIWEDLQR